MSHEQIQKLLLDVSLVTKSAVKSQQHDFSFKKKKKKKKERKKERKNTYSVLF